MDPNDALLICSDERDWDCDRDLPAENPEESRLVREDEVAVPLEADLAGKKLS